MVLRVIPSLKPVPKAFEAASLEAKLLLRNEIFFSGPLYLKYSTFSFSVNTYQ